MVRAHRSGSPPKDDASSDLQGNVPDRCELALVLVDVINDFEFPNGERMYLRARKAAPVLARLKAAATAADVPCIYANDHFGRWRSDFAAQVRHCLDDGVRGAPITKQLQPQATDYFVLKPKHSAFYQTCMETLLQHLGAKTVIVAGFATDICVSMTASDAYLRGYSLIIPRDASAALTQAAHRNAIESMRRVLHAQTPRASAVDFHVSRRKPARAAKGRSKR